MIARKTIFIIALMAAAAQADEGRIEISLGLVPFTITNSGCYVVAEDLFYTNGTCIDVNADDVTLDLNGFALRGTGYGTGINQMNNRKNLTIRNGTVRGWRNKYGIYTPGINTRIEDIRVSDNSDGILTGNGAVVVRCTAMFNAYDGISTGIGSLISDCVSMANHSDGIVAGGGSSILRCSVGVNTNRGIYAGAGCAISDCAAYANVSNGISVGDGCVIVNCTVMTNRGSGIRTAGRSTVRNCVARGNVGPGISTGPGSSIQRCAATMNLGDGILTDQGSFVEDCLSAGNHGEGIRAASGARLVGNQTVENGYYAGEHAGIYSSGANNYLADNCAIDNDRGIELSGNGSSMAIRNFAIWNQTRNYLITGAHTVGPFITITNAIDCGYEHANFTLE